MPRPCVHKEVSHCSYSVINMFYKEVKCIKLLKTRLNCNFISLEARACENISEVVTGSRGCNLEPSKSKHGAVCAIRN